MKKYGDYPVGTWFICPTDPKFNHIRLTNGYVHTHFQWDITRDPTYKDQEVYYGYTTIVYLPEGLS